MSQEKAEDRAQLWLEAAKDDLDSARILKDSGQYAHSCFHSQQSSEKAVKAVFYLKDEEPWGHSVIKMLTGIEQLDASAAAVFSGLKKKALFIDRLYIPTRYPDGLPDINPSEAFDKTDADKGIEYAGQFYKAAKKVLDRTQ
ncbi:MAG: HEPN domain-containing protein [Fibrobacterota bacterium]